MMPLRLGFDHPGYLWLLLALPLIWWLGYRSLSVLGNLRKWLALSLRTIVWTIVVLALAGVQVVWVSDKVTVMYLLDQSESIPRAKRQVMLEFVRKNVKRFRDAQRGDKAGIIVFGRNAMIEIPPFDDDIRVRQLGSLLERLDATNLEEALNIAQAAMPEDTSRRIVIVTDGNENLGVARDLAARIADAGIGIDVVPVLLNAKNEVLVEKIDLPTDIRKGQPFQARVVVNNYSEAGEGPDAEIAGRLRLTQRVAGSETILLEEEITLGGGKNVFPLTHTIDQPAPYVYEAEFLPNDRNQDGLRQNNKVTSYTHVRGEARVLIIEDKSRAGDFDLMIDSLRNEDIEVVQQYTDELFGSLAELQAFDSVILAGVPRVSDASGGVVTSFTDEQIQMLVDNTHRLGAGLLMIGGPEAFGAGGWTGTELEKAMPVDFQIKNAKVEAVGALACIMHASEMADGNHWQKVIARAAIEQLGASDYAGVLHWGVSGDQWMWGGGLLEVGPHRKAMLAAVSRMTPGDMPQFDPAMKMAVKGLSNTPASVKHCIIISDGDPSDPSPSTISAFKKANITISTVAVASHGLTESQRLRSIAQATGGKYYAVKSGKALPRIFQREARRVSKPLVYEPEGGVVPAVPPGTVPHPLLDGIDRVFPNTRGFVMTQTKETSLAQVLLQSNKPAGQPENATILAVWPYGAGRTAVLTTDAGARWASTWNQWEDYEKFFSQLVRWTMRPTGDTGKYSIATNVKDGEVQVVVNALNEDDSFMDFLDMQANVSDMNASPDSGERRSGALSMRQAAPGRYVGTFKADSAGNYFVTVIPKPGAAPLTIGVSVPYSDEFRVRETNLALIEMLAGTQPKGGDEGVVAPPLDLEPSEDLVNTDSFRGGLPLARSIRDAWPWFLLAGCCLFLADVFVRRVAINFGWVATAMNKLRGKTSEKDAAVTARLDALRKNKEALDESLEKRRASVRFEPTATDDGEDVQMGMSDPGARGTSGGTAKQEDAAKEAGPSYTERLLAAKRRARKD